MPLVNGDASHEVLIKAAGIAQARLLIITTPAIAISRAIVENSRRVNPRIRIITRAENKEMMTALHQLGVNEIVQPQFEAGLEITRLALSFLKIPNQEIKRFTDEIRHELYAPLSKDQ